MVTSEIVTSADTVSGKDWPASLILSFSAKTPSPSRSTRTSRLFEAVLKRTADMLVSARDCARRSALNTDRRASSRFTLILSKTVL